MIGAEVSRLETRIVRDDDPVVRQLESEGFVLVGESWAARLTIDSEAPLERLRDAVASARSRGFTVDELGVDAAADVCLLEATNHDDYPVTPATTHERSTEASARQLWRTQRVFGARRGHDLVGAAALTTANGMIGDIAWASVLADYRGTGLGVAVTALGILTLNAEGQTSFSTGGAAANARSLNGARSLGMTIDERWRSYQRHA